MAHFWKSAETAVRASGMAFGMLAPFGFIAGGIVGTLTGGLPAAIVGVILGTPLLFGVCLLHLPLAGLCVKMDRIFNRDKTGGDEASKFDTSSLFPLKKLTKSFTASKNKPDQNNTPAIQQPAPPVPPKS